MQVIPRRWAFGCSTFSPSISQRYCCGVNCRASFVEPLDPIPPSVAEQKQHIGERVQFKLLALGF
ncbi:hypothetical protein [uncultured Subdoligranulum sp.]|uniref:hypothetical protein n=1 Tax=uncultured Subdoligranulum sp. TaxID=512298 RepID=UPI00262A911D|nr:hypothetical protein [uncultured Subdoligranulum sp.]